MRTNACITNYLNLLFVNTAWANIGNAGGLRASTVAGSLYLSLHTADPGISGSQSTSEAAYSGYARIAVARNAGQWTVATPQVSNGASLSWPACVSGSETETHWGIGTDSTGAGNLLYSGVIGGAFMGFTAETTGNITIPGNTLAVNGRVAFYPMIADWTFPGGITEGTIYYVKTVSSDVITISATLGGIAVSITSAGAGSCAPASPLSVSTGIAPTVAAGGLVLEER